MADLQANGRQILGLFDKVNYPVEIVELGLSSFGKLRSPKRFTLKCSNDGVNWKIYKKFENVPYLSD